MSKRWLKTRVADVREHWSATERRQRALAGQARVGELLAKLGLTSNGDQSLDVGQSPWAMASMRNVVPAPVRTR